MVKNVPNVPGGKGNTNNLPPRKCGPALKWVFTWNNYHALAPQDCEALFQKKCKKYIFQKETGANGTKHLQGAVWLLKKCRGTEIGLPTVVHWEQMKDEEGSINYCQKKETRDEGTEPYIWGFPKPLKVISELRPWQLEVEKIATSEPDGRTVYWFYDYKGGLGKSAFCKYMYVKHNTLVIQGGKLADIMNIIFNTDMDNVNCVIIDIPRNTGNRVSYNSIECILNGMITNTKFETGVKVFNPPVVCVFANEEPDKSCLSEDRWVIKDLSLMN